MLVLPKYSRRWSDAFEGRRVVSPNGRRGARASVPYGLSFTSMLSVPVWGSLTGALLPGCHVALLIVLSVDVVRSSGWWCELEWEFMLRLPASRGGLVLVAKQCFFTGERAVTSMTSSSSSSSSSSSHCAARARSFRPELCCLG